MAQNQKPAVACLSESITRQVFQSSLVKPTVIAIVLMNNTRVNFINEIIVSHLRMRADCNLVCDICFETHALFSIS